MLLTFNQTLFLILTVAAVVIAVFLILFLLQLRRTAREAEKSLQEFQVTLEKLKTIEDKVERRLDETGTIIQSAKKHGFGSVRTFPFLNDQSGQAGL